MSIYSSTFAILVFYCNSEKERLFDKGGINTKIPASRRVFFYVKRDCFHSPLPKVG